MESHVVSFLEPMATFGYSSLSMAHSTEELVSFISPEKNARYILCALHGSDLAPAWAVSRSGREPMGVPDLKNT